MSAPDARAATADRLVSMNRTWVLPDAAFNRAIALPTAVADFPAAAQRHGLADAKLEPLR